MPDVPSPTRPKAVASAARRSTGDRQRSIGGRAAARHGTAAWTVRLVVVTGLVGVAGGVAGIAVFVALHLIQVVAFGLPFVTGREAANEPDPLHRFATVLAAGVLAAVAWWALRRWGRPVVSVQGAVGGTRMPSLVTVANAAIQIVVVGLGASIGKEVAPRELGAWLSQLVTERAGLTVRETRILVACGAAAGLAAVYDVPLGGALFAVEVLLGEITVATALPAFATSAIAALVARAAVPVETLYAIPHVTTSPSLVVWSIVAGPVIGVAGVGFVALTALLQRRQPRGWRLLVAMPLVFAAVGLVTVWLPQVMGNGRAAGLAAMHARLDGPALAGMAPLVFVLVLAVAKTATTAGTIGSGAAGGTLTPSIAIGAAVGAFLGGAWMLLWPGSGPSLVAFAFIGAAAFLATTMRAPFTALVLVVEFTGQGTAVLIPSLIAVGGAVAVAYVLGRRRLVGVA